MELETVVRRYTAQDFIDNPGLYDTLAVAWRTKSWFMVFGEEPVGAVLARLKDDGITLYYKRQTDPSAFVPE